MLDLQTPPALGWPQSLSPVLHSFSLKSVSSARVMSYSNLLCCGRGYSARGASWSMSMAMWKSPPVVLAIIGRDESLHDGPKMAARFRQPEARIEIVT